MNSPDTLTARIDAYLASRRQAGFALTAYFAQGRPSIHGKPVHGFAPCRSTAREAGRIELSIKDDHSSMSGFSTMIKIATAYKAAGAAIEAEPLGWIPPFF
jgi:hypothetical protein